MNAKADDVYAARKAANEESLVTADHHQEIWTIEEILLLEEFWGSAKIEEIAEALGRTIEACRQKHYDIGKLLVERAKREQAKADLWTRGFHSIAEMEAYYNED